MVIYLLLFEYVIHTFTWNYHRLFKYVTMQPLNSPSLKRDRIRFSLVTVSKAALRLKLLSCCDPSGLEAFLVCLTAERVVGT